MKNFTTEKWLEVLETKNWIPVDPESTGVDSLANKFDSNIEEGLNELAPYKLFTVKSHYKFGLSDNTKNMMEQRDSGY